MAKFHSGKSDRSWHGEDRRIREALLEYKTRMELSPWYPVQNGTQIDIHFRDVLEARERVVVENVSSLVAAQRICKKHNSDLELVLRTRKRSKS